MEPYTFNFPEETRHFMIRWNDTPGLEKVSFKIDDPNVHYTLRIWMKDKMVDLHKTYEKSKDRYETIFRISFYQLARFMVLHKKVLKYLVPRYFLKRVVNVGKLRRHGILAFDTSDAEGLEDLVKIKRKKFKFPKSANATLMLNKLIDPRNIPEEGTDGFMLFDRNLKYAGFLVKHPTKKKSFYWVTKKDFYAFNKQYVICLYNIIVRHLRFENRPIILEEMRTRLIEQYPDLGRPKEKSAVA